ncbi:hypothetical protein [Ekhidna sp.]|uniref:hypothetical protein n=1 Tax=Ekhidna sp. TaxID=2608089 RepID=UPI003B50BA8C
MKYTLFLIFIVSGFFSQSQENVDIVQVIDDLTVKWDMTAIKMKNYQGIQEFCLTEDYKTETIELLDNIHHWDTTLYFIVQEKFDTNSDKEVAATLEDIEKLETEYSTENFKDFIVAECDMLKVIEESFDAETVKQYEKDIKKFEKELVKYLNSITYRIDIIDEHIHHLNFD